MTYKLTFMYDKVRPLHSALKTNPCRGRTQQLFPSRSSIPPAPVSAEVKVSSDLLEACRTWAGGSYPCDTLFNAGQAERGFTALAAVQPRLAAGERERASLLAAQGPLEHGFRILGQRNITAQGDSGCALVIPAPVHINTVSRRIQLDF